MYSRRCVYCQTLQQVDTQTQVCSYCGRNFSPQLSRSSRQKSLPPAPSHRAGHSFGLHPEDQPYQSSMMIAQHSPAIEEELPRRVQSEPEYIVFPDTDEAPALKAQRAALIQSRRSVRRPAAKVEQKKTRRLVLRPAAKVEQAKMRRLVLRPAAKVEQAKTSRLIPPLPKTLFSKQAISWLLTLSCIIFLLATSIIAFALIGKRATLATAVVQVSPNMLRAQDTFTLSGGGFSPHDQMSFYHDNHQPLSNAQGQPLSISADVNGHFSIQVQVPESWSVGSHVIGTVDSLHDTSTLTHITILAPSVSPPVLQISPLEVYFSGAAPGIVSSQMLTLTNTGGGQVSWSVTSDQPWLSTVPASASFSGSQSVQVTVNRGDLAPQAYVGHLIFTQKNAAIAALTIPVSMVVTPTPADLTISTTALTYAASTSQNPGDQFITLHNSGDQVGSWSSTFSTESDASWIVLTPDHGTLAPGEDETITVSALAANLPIGSYQGSINFAGDISAQVNTSMSVVAAGNLVISPLTLDFTALVGQSPAEKQVALQNNGGTTLSWQSQVTTVDQGSWLQVTPAQGSLAAGEQTAGSVSISSQGMSVGSYQGKITFTSSSGSSQQMAVSLIISAATVSGIHAQPSTLTFVAATGSDPATQSIVVTNTGNAALQWTASTEGTGGDALTITPDTGTLALHQSVVLTVAVHLTASSPGTMSPTIVLKAGGSGGSTTVSQSVLVTITAGSVTPSATTITAAH
jgi:hypothetical protein